MLMNLSTSACMKHRPGEGKDQFQSSEFNLLNYCLQVLHFSVKYMAREF